MNIKVYFCLIILIFSFNPIVSQDLSSIRFDAEHKNDAWSQNKLGVMYENGEGVSKNANIAFTWFQKSASNGYKYGYYNLGRHYQYGLSVPIDMDKAVSMYETAASLYHTHSCLLMGKWYLNGTNVSQNYSKAARYFKDAAFGGSDEGKYYMGYCYAYGYGVAQDSIRALLWLDRALEDKYYFAYLMKGIMYEKGVAVKQDVEKAFDMYLLGDNYNDAACSNSLAIQYLNGTCVEADTSKAIALFEKSANNGNLYGARNLAYKYKYGEGVKKNLRTAAYWFEKSAEHNDETSYNELIMAYYALEDYSSLFRIVSKGYQLKFTNCMNTLAYCYAKGEGTSLDFNKALLTINEAIALYPNDPNLYDSKGEILWLKGSKKQAKRIWWEVKTMSPKFYQENDTELNKYIMSTFK